VVCAVSVPGALADHVAWQEVGAALVPKPKPLTFGRRRRLAHLCRQVLLLLQNEEGGDSQLLLPQQLHAFLRAGRPVKAALFYHRFPTVKG